MCTLATAIELIGNFFVWVLIIAAIMSWLIAFQVLNTHNRVVYMIYDFLHRITQPVLRPVRKILPDLGGIDISPLVVILLIILLQRLLLIDLGLARGCAIY